MDRVGDGAAHSFRVDLWILAEHSGHSAPAIVDALVGDWHHGSMGFSNSLHDDSWLYGHKGYA